MNKKIYAMLFFVMVVLFSFIFMNGINKDIDLSIEGNSGLNEDFLKGGLDDESDVVLLSSSSFLYEWRPSCIDPDLVSNSPWSVTSFWNGKYGQDFSVCYINESVAFIKYDYGIKDGKLWRDWEDLYSTEIGGQSNSIKVERGIILHIEYYFPSNNGTCYQEDVSGLYGHPHQPIYYGQKIFFNNVDYVDANCGGCEDFADAQYDLNLSQRACDVWHVLDIHSTEFENEFNEVDGVNRLVSFNLQFTNAYIRDIKIIYGQNMDKTYKIY